VTAQDDLRIAGQDSKVLVLAAVTSTTLGQAYPAGGQEVGGSSISIISPPPSRGWAWTAPSWATVIPEPRRG
jgi:hypothetical protein